MTARVVTRFAPSPTGYLHIGGARTALFNWLFARHCGGKFLLRIEDTDRERSTPEAVTAIHEGLRWLGLDWDGEVVSQSARIARHREAVDLLLRNSQAYRCYVTPEELAAARKEARDAGTRLRFRSPWRDRNPEEAPAGMPYAVRLRAPQEGETVIEDKVQGRVVWQNEDLDDLVLLRSDSSPTYMLAVVADDHDMEVTHVIRGDDHLTNAARQVQIYDALGWPRPAFAHIPLIHGPDGKKYSKRHGAIGLDSFAADGYLPGAMRNYLARLGWAHGDDEFFATEQAVEWFTLEAVGRSAARLDPAKLLNLNAVHLRSLPAGELLDALGGYLSVHREIDLASARRAMMEPILGELAARARTLAELADMAKFITSEGAPEPDAKALQQLTGEGRELLAALTPTLAAASLWEREELERILRDFAEKRSVPLKRIAQPVRAALTGSVISPGIFDVMTVLGRSGTMARLQRWGADAAGEQTEQEDESGRHTSHSPADLPEQGD